MSSAKIDIDDVELGAGYGCFWELLEDDGTTVIPLTDCEAKLQVRRLPNDADALLTLTSNPAAGLVVTAAAGRVDATFTRAVLAALATPGPQLLAHFYYDLQILPPTGEAYYIAHGKLTARIGVTR